MGLFSLQALVGGTKPVACDGGLENCAVASFPWIIAGLIALVLVLILLRAGLQFRDRFRPRAPRPAPPQREPRIVPAGSPIVAPPPGEEPPPAKRPVEERRPPPKPATAAKPTPLQLRVEDRPDLLTSDFVDSVVQGDFGELLTAAVLSSGGWKRLASKLPRGQGLDGLFVRELKGGGGFECLATETKTNSGVYQPATMTDEKIAGDIDLLYETGALRKHEADELLRALTEGSSFFRKELWRHDLSSGLTTIVRLGRQGEKGQSTTRSNARLISALFISLEQFDRHAHYLGGQSVDDEENN